ncbi:MAG: hypothetical protein GF331_09495 [Chitinivibrionales bacterium]|nr:hypothetical protein [Chitinivibrionales bacterium]
MRKACYFTDALSEFIERHTIATMPQLKRVLGTGVDMTVLRKLRTLGYHASYSHRGKYYTLSEIPQFDERGLWSFGQVRFSRHGTLRNTAREFVTESLAGYTAAELRRELRVEVKGALLDLVRHRVLERQQVSHELVYVSGVPQIGRRQLMTRQDNDLPTLGQLAQDDGPVLAHQLRACIILFVSLLDEKQRRLWAGLESMRMGHGGDSAIARLLGISAQTVAKGRRQLLDRDVEVERTRCAGGGRPAMKKNARDHRENP